jgi:hypothetical protein
MLEYKTPQYEEESKLLAKINNDFLSFLWFCVQDTGRDVNFWDNHLLSYVSQDILQSCSSIHWLAYEGVTNPCKRELRFLIELAIKQCYIEQEMPHASIADKLVQYRTLLDGPNISIKSKIRLPLLPDSERDAFLEDIGRSYGCSSKYVHLTTQQVEERIALVKRGITVGKEGIVEIKEMIDLIRKCYALILVFIFHSVTSDVAGDWLVDSDGSSNKWYFGKSKYIALIDSYFDYKHERQSKIGVVQSLRKRTIEF